MSELKFIRNISYTTSSSLLNAVRSGNDPAWEKFYAKYSGMIYAVGKKWTLSKEDCDDLIIEVMKIFWKKMDKFVYDRSKGKFRSYLARIADNCAMQLYFKQKKNKNITAMTADSEYPAEVDRNMMEEWKDFLLQKALEHLRLSVDTETYQVFYMSFVQQCSVAEIMEVTRKTANNIYVIRSRCLKKLSALLKEFRQLDETLLSNHSNKNKSEY